MGRGLRAGIRGRRALGAGALAVGLIGSLVGAAGPAGAEARTGPASARIGAAPFVPGGAEVLGALSDATPLRLDVVLRPRDPAALAAFATAVSTPGSPSYRHYLAPGQFAATFGPTPAAVGAVERALRAIGLAPAGANADPLAIAVQTTAGAASHAFATPLVRLRLPSGRVGFANTLPPRLPASVAPFVEAVIGLDSLHPEAPLAIRASRAPRRPLLAPHVATGGPQPCSAASATGQLEGGYTADQLASAYGMSALYAAGDLGAGVTVALYELEPNLPSDIAAYQSCYGTSAAVSYVAIDGGAGTGAGAGEAALDIEDVIGLAPRASIQVYDGPNSATGQYDTYAAIVNADAARVISTSWGICEAYADPAELQAENTLFQQAAAQGQTVVAAAGDSGSEDCDQQYQPNPSLAVDDPASQPFVTGVGGTTLSTLGPPPVEQAWNDAASGNGAGGGGVSAVWPMPSYQSGAPASLNVVNANSSGTPCGAASGYCREVPDVSAAADPSTGYVVRYAGSWGVIGGTSAAAPLWAAIAALADASSSCAGASVGFMNPTLYQVAGGSGYALAFDDVTTGNNDYTGTNGGLFPAGSGYDMATGLGTPVASASGGGLVAGLCAQGVALPAATMTSPSAGFTSPPGPGPVAIGVGWSGNADASSFAVRYRMARAGGSFGSYAPLATASPSATSTSIAGALPGATYCVSARGIGATSVAGPWSAERCTAVPLDDRQLGRSRGWYPRSGSAWFEGTYLAGSKRGSWVDARVRARRVALVVGLSPSGPAVVGVYWGSTLLKRVRLYAKAARADFVLPIATFASIRSGTIRVVLLSQGARAEIDGIAVSRV